MSGDDIWRPGESDEFREERLEREHDRKAMRASPIAFVAMSGTELRLRSKIAGTHCPSLGIRLLSITAWPNDSRSSLT